MSVDPGLGPSTEQYLPADELQDISRWLRERRWVSFNKGRHYLTAQLVAFQPRFTRIKVAFPDGEETWIQVLRLTSLSAKPVGWKPLPEEPNHGSQSQGVTRAPQTPAGD